MDLDSDSNDSITTPPDFGDSLRELIQVPQLVRGQNQGVIDSTPASRHALTVPGSDTSLAPTSQMTAAPKLPLYDIPISGRYFWKQSIVEQLTLEITDKYPEQTKRPMPKHEILVMALNEIAVHHGYGFFFHLPSKGGQRRAPNEEICPPSRLPPSAGSDLPNIYFMRRAWTAEARRSFFGSGHRTRYLHCDGLLGIPDDDTPLYAIQHMFHLRASSFLTTPPSLVVFANQSAFYLASTEDLKRLIGAQSSNPLTEGLDQGPRLNKTPYLWDNSPSTKLQVFAQLTVTNTEELYHRIVEECTSARLRPTFTALELRRRIPRPLAPDRGFDLGVPQPLEMDVDDARNSFVAGDGESHDYSGPQSRRGGRLARGRGGPTGSTGSNRRRGRPGG